VLIVEAIAQAGGALLLTEIADRDGKLMFFTGIERAKFRKPVLPGDQLRIEVEVLACGAKRCRIGNANAAVLPVPVCAPAMRSRPASTSGMACSWTGEGFS